MKITIYELLGMIKDGKAPKRIALRNEEYIYMEDARNYQCLTEPYEMMKIYDGWCLNDEVTILETTITYNQDKIEKINKIRINYNSINIDKAFETGTTTFFREKDIEIFQCLSSKINEIIDHLNNQ